jgi:hypothetical protein
MSNDLHSGDLHNNGHGDYEREDFSTATIVGSMIGLIVLCVVSFVIVVGMYRYLEKTQMEHVAANPMVPMKADTRHMTPGEKPGDKPLEIQAFPSPQLQEDDVKDMRDQLWTEEGRLQSYGWVDQDSGEAHIPVARAMELIAERGLPVRSAAAAEAPATVAGSKGTTATPKSKTKKAGK